MESVSSNAAQPAQNAPTVAKKAWQTPQLARIPLQETNSGIVILPIEILGIQGPS